jgi:hypothetical protein
MIFKYVFKGSFISLNEYINYERMQKYIAASIKKRETERVYYEALSQKKGQVNKKIFIVFHWFVKDKKKDKDNIAFAKKFILDGLVLAKVLKNDGFDEIEGFLDFFSVDPKDERVEVTLIEVDKNLIELEEY